MPPRRALASAKTGGRALYIELFQLRRPVRRLMAQDVLARATEAVITDPSGYMMVDCGMLGMEMTRIQ